MRTRVGAAVTEGMSRRWRARQQQAHARVLAVETTGGCSVAGVRGQILASECSQSG